MIKTALVISVVFVGLHARADDPARPAKIDDALSRSFRGVSSLRQVDGAVIEELLRRTGGKNLADVGEAFEPTDVIRDERPTRRFVVGGLSSDNGRFWVLCYEHGGRGYHYHIALLAVDGKETEVLKAGQWLPGWKERKKVVTLARVLAALRKEEVRYANHW